MAAFVSRSVPPARSSSVASTPRTPRLERVLDESQGRIQLPSAFTSVPHQELELALDRDRTLWAFMRPKGRPSCTRGLLSELALMQVSLKRWFVERHEAPIGYFVLGSHIPGIFNLGGDLVLIQECVRKADR